MNLLLPALLLLLVLSAPNLWIHWILRHYEAHQPVFPTTGAELARRMLDRAGLTDVRVEATQQGDHYDPEEKVVRLRPKHLGGGSLTALTVAAHEVGHAVQDGAGYPLLALRSELVVVADRARRAVPYVLIGFSIATLLTRIPALWILAVALCVSGMALGALVHLITLPVEWDASFGRALPMLDEGRFLSRSDQPAARQILRAAALTYLAGALAGLLNPLIWLRLLRRG